MPPPIAGRLPDVVLDAGCIAPCTRSACCRCSTALELQRLVDLAAMARARAPLRYHCGTMAHRTPLLEVLARGADPTPHLSVDANASVLLALRQRMRDEFGGFWGPFAFVSDEGGPQAGLRTAASRDHHSA